MLRNVNTVTTPFYPVHLTSSNPTFSDGKANKNTPKGVFCRNTALEWLIENNCQSGVFYFADDDNTYDRRVFNQIRSVPSLL